MSFLPVSQYISVNHYTIYFCFFSLLLFQFLIHNFLPGVLKFSISVINSFPSVHFTLLLPQRSIVFSFVIVLS